MTLRRVLGTSALIAGLSVLAAGTASAAPRFRNDGGGRTLAVELETTTDRLHAAADQLRGRGRPGHEIASRVHRMDEWARYYRAAVEREGFRSLKARQRFDRFLVEYRSASEVLDHARRPLARREVARLHATVAEIHDAYGMRVARRHERDRDRWDDDDRWERRRDGRH